jgi:uncharacterized protein YjbJ (UPF0337 family)
LPHIEIPLESVFLPPARPRAHFCRHPGGKQTNIIKSRIIMNTLEIKGDWNITKGKLKQKWAKLTDDDLKFVKGQQEELLGRIQKRTGETREVVEKVVKEYNESCGCK